MAISRLGAKSDDNSAISISTPVARNFYSAAIDLTPGIYTITTASANTATVEMIFTDDTTATFVTVGGVIVASIAKTTNRVIAFSTQNNSSVLITPTGIEATASSQVLDTINSSGTYVVQQPGVAKVLLIGGGGGSGNLGYASAGGGGGSGFATIRTVFLNNDVSVTLGAGAALGGVGGTTNFGNLSALGGNPASGSTGGAGGSGGGGGAISTGAYQNISGAGGGSDGGAGGNPGSSPGGTGTGVNISGFVTPGSGGAPGSPGGIYGGGGGGNAGQGAPNENPFRNNGGGGGGGVAGSGTSGGAGRVFVLRWPG